ncbi:flavodoxin domain-containing protein [Planococcus salinus]|nr:flavodoxin domain-containing protein [Planococcus salinus]
MKPVLILYLSGTGNTEQIACLLQEHLERKGLAAELKDISLEDFDLEYIRYYAGLLFGTYTYDDGDLPFEIEDFYDELGNTDLTGIVIGVFGSGDTAYYSFCQAVDLMKEQFQKTHANVLEHTVKVDLFPDEPSELTDIEKLADDFVAALQPFPVANEERDGEKNLYNE